MFRCSRCNKIMWLDTYRSADASVICSDCHQKEWELHWKKLDEEKTKRANDAMNKFSGDAYNVVYKYVERHYENTEYPYGEQEKLIQLLEVKYNICISKEDLLNVQNLIEEKIDEREKLRELDEFEKEILGNKEVDLKKEKSKIKTFCSICKQEIDNKTFGFSKTNLGKPLCLTHQGTKYQRMLFEALKVRGVDCEYEFFDGFKHVDIAIPNAKLFIEIDGAHHSTDATQLNKDLKRDEFSSKDGYQTKHYTNKEIAENLTSIVNALVLVIKERQK